MSRRPDEMLPPACVPFAQRLIDSPERAIADPDVRAHVADCPECRDLAAALEAAAALLAQAQREGAGPSRGHLQSLAKRAATPTAVPAERRRNLFPTPLRWGFAGAAVVVLAVALTLNRPEVPPPQAHLGRAQGSVLVDGQPFAAGEAQVIPPDTDVSVENGPALLQFDDGSTVVLDAGSQVRLLENGGVRITRGRLIARAAGSHVFPVLFGGGEAVAAQGMFEVDANGDWPRVGSLGAAVSIHCFSGDAELEGGDAVLLDYEMGYEFAPRPEGAKLPAWVEPFAAELGAFDLGGAAC